MPQRAHISWEKFRGMGRKSSFAGFWGEISRGPQKLGGGLGKKKSPGGGWLKKIGCQILWTNDKLAV